MTTHSYNRSPNKKTLLQQLGNLLTGDRQASVSLSAETRLAESRNQPTTINASVALPFSAPTVFIDYAAEGDEPADLALADLIPVGLTALNLPYSPPDTAKSAAVDSDQSSATSYLKPPTHRYNSQEEMMQNTVAEELAELTPMELTSLNVRSQKPFSTPQASTSHPKQENSVEQNKVNQGTDHQVKNQSVKNQISQPIQPPLPDLATLKQAKHQAKYQAKRAALPSADSTTHVSTVRVPTAYLSELEKIVEGLLHQQSKQSRHNEQLGALVKQLLSRIAQQQIELSRIGKRDHDDIQKMIQDCLTSS